MAIFDFSDDDAFGRAIQVDTNSVIIEVIDVEQLRSLQVNRLAVLRSSLAGQHLIGIISKITRKAGAVEVRDDGEEDASLFRGEELNAVHLALIGTLFDRRGNMSNVFSRTLDTVPEIGANSFSLEGERLSRFMSVISGVAEGGNHLDLGNYTLDRHATAYLNGNRFFQRHALVVGGTGSGKSWTTARILEQVASLPTANAILFDLHGEYSSLTGKGFSHLKIAGPSDQDTGKTLSDGVLHLPFWLLEYEALVTMFVDRTDQNAPNQAMLVSNAIIDGKKKTLEDAGAADALANFTVNSPVPFHLEAITEKLDRLNSEMVPGARGEKQGPHFGKLSRLISRINAKTTDRRLGFMFSPPETSFELKWLDDLVAKLLEPSNVKSTNGVKILDFSDVPSDVLPLIAGAVANLVFSVHQWSTSGVRHPIAMLCDEAHLYVPNLPTGQGGDQIAIFERIAKEGRKYGVGLVVISQRPSEVNKTVLSQCSNVVAMRLTNGEDQAVISKLLPDNLTGFSGILPALDIGEALVVGDASLLPTRIRVSEPENKPNSMSLNFWDLWSDTNPKSELSNAVNAWRKQSYT